MKWLMTDQMKNFKVGNQNWHYEVYCKGFLIETVGVKPSWSRFKRWLEEMN